MKAKTILVFGLPGAGKTYFAERLKEHLGDAAVHINGDGIRAMYNDWDFSEEGRARQAERMNRYAIEENVNGKHVILDFICPKEEYRELIDADIMVYANRTPVRDFPNTTKMFEPPSEYDFLINDESVIEHLITHIAWLLQEFDDNAPTALMIGRFQPFHAGHKALFEKALEKHGQVCIGVRDMPRDDKNPFNFDDVADRIEHALMEYSGKFRVLRLPNIVDVVYGRDVGWTVSKIDLPAEIESISATQIRAQMNK